MNDQGRSAGGDISKSNIRKTTLWVCKGSSSTVLSPDVLNSVWCNCFILY